MLRKILVSWFLSPNYQLYIKIIRIMSAKIDEQVLSKYDILSRLGQGAYGYVWKAKKIKNGSIVALKKIYDAFRNETDAQRTFR